MLNNENILEMREYFKMLPNEEFDQTKMMHAGQGTRPACIASHVVYHLDPTEWNKLFNPPERPNILKRAQELLGLDINQACKLFETIPYHKDAEVKVGNVYVKGRVAVRDATASDVELVMLGLLDTGEVKW